MSKKRNKDIDEKKPNKKERIALSLFYNRFYDLYEEISSKDFFKKNSNLRFYKIREIFSVYKELLSYEPINYYLKYMKSGARPPLEGVIAEDLFSFIRNTLLHFPIFNSWNDVYITKNLATWDKEASIHKFLLKCTKIKIDRKGVVKYRIWEHSKKKMTYVKIIFPEQYSDDKRIYLKDIISEKNGVKFCISLMKQVLDIQVEGSEKSDIEIMSQAYMPVTDSSLTT
jgi:hypothetical protein